MEIGAVDLYLSAHLFSEMLGQVYCIYSRETRLTQIDFFFFLRLFLGLALFDSAEDRLESGRERRDDMQQRAASQI